MPDELLAAIPPIIAAPMEAGSGPILRPCGASRRLASAPITPGCRAIKEPSWEIREPFHPSPSTINTLSVIACPDSDVPAAR